MGPGSAQLVPKMVLTTQDMAEASLVMHPFARASAMSSLMEFLGLGSVEGFFTLPNSDVCSSRPSGFRIQGCRLSGLHERAWA